MARNDDVLNEEVLAEMLGLGGMAGGPMGEEGPPMDDLGGEEDMPMDMGGEDEGLEDMDMGMGDELGDEMGGEMVEVDKGTLEDVMNQVADGTMSVEDAMDQCCGDSMGDDMGMGDELGDEGMDLGDEEDMGMEDDMGGLGDEEAGPPMENINKIAKMLTDDPDLFNEV